jgi:hypothetical protein
MLGAEIPSVLQSHEVYLKWENLPFSRNSYLWRATLTEEAQPKRHDGSSPALTMLTSIR